MKIVRPGWRRRADPEATVSGYFRANASSGKSAYAYPIRHLGLSLRALVALYQLPCLHIAPSTEIEGAAIRGPLLQGSALWRVTGFATAVLTLPQEPGQYSLGAARQTLRRKVRQAKRLGIQWAEVYDPQERRNLLQLANECERTHPNVTYRNPAPSNDDLLSYRLWLVALAADGRPLLLSVTPADGELAWLRYFRTLGTGHEQSHARYLMTEVLAERLIRLGVRYLIDGSNLSWLPDGLRHFQRMTGFRIVRLRIACSDRNGIGRGTRDGLEAIGAESDHGRQCHPNAALAETRN